MSEKYTDEECDILQDFIDGIEVGINDDYEDVLFIDERLDDIDERLVELEEFKEKLEEIAGIRAEIAGFRGEIADLDTEIDEKEAECLEIETTHLEPVTDRIVEVDLLISVKEDLLADAYSVYETMADNVHALGDDPSTDPADFDEAVAELEEYIAYLEELESILEAEIAELNSERETLDSDYAEISGMIDDCWEIVNGLIDQQRELDDKILDKEQEIEDIESTIPGEGSIEEEKAALEAEQVTLNGERADSLAHAEYLQGKKDTHSADYDAHCV